MRRSLLLCSLSAWSLLGAGCGEELEYSSWALPLSAVCTIKVDGKGTKQVETDYVPHVVCCENGGADMEALKAQAVAARSYMYYASKNSGSICDSQKCQVYGCSRCSGLAGKGTKYYAAAQATAGQVLMWSSVVIASFYVAGAKPSTTSCVAKSTDPDSTNTEKWVTYNQGKSGSAVTQTKLGWVNPGNKYNRGCKSQNGAKCLSQSGKKYSEILKFYYGADIQLVTGSGPCVSPPKPDAGPPQDVKPPPQDVKPPPQDVKPPPRDVKPPPRDVKPPPRDTRPPPRDGPRVDTRPFADGYTPGGESGPPLHPGASSQVLHGGCSTTGDSSWSWPGLLLLLVSRRRGSLA